MCTRKDPSAWSPVHPSASGQSTEHSFAVCYIRTLNCAGSSARYRSVRGFPCQSVDPCTRQWLGLRLHRSRPIPSSREILGEHEPNPRQRTLVHTFLSLPSSFHKYYDYLVVPRGKIDTYLEIQNPMKIIDGPAAQNCRSASMRASGT